MAIALHALVLVVGVAYAVLVSMRTGLAAIGVAVGAEMALAYVCRPFDFPASAWLNWKYAVPIVALGIAAAFTLPLESAIVILAGAALLLRLATALLYHWPGGVTACSVPLVGLVVEAFTLSYIQKGASPLG